MNFQLARSCRDGAQIFSQFIIKKEYVFRLIYPYNLAKIPYEHIFEDLKDFGLHLSGEPEMLW